MARPIDADALFAEFENVDWYNNADRDEIAERLVLQAPTIDAVSVVHGEWIDRSDGGRILHPWWESYECMNCGYSGSKAWNFCPWCGAKMKGADDEVR